jgi:exonuclease VII large subunit
MDPSALTQAVSTFVGSSVGAGIVTQVLTSRSQRLLQARQQAYEVDERRERERHERILQQERVGFEERISRLQQEFQARLQHSLEKFKSDYSGLRSKRLDAYTEVCSALSDLLDAAGRALAQIHSIPADKPVPSYYGELLEAAGVP